MEDDLDRLGISGHNDHLTNTAIESLRRFVGAFLGLLVVGRLLDEVQEGDGQLGICEGISFL